MRHSVTTAATAAVVLAAAVSGSPHCSCCPALARQPDLEGKVYFPNSTQYDARLDTYYSANAALPAWCMVMPESTSDVSTVARVISSHGCPFGMRSGAHSAWAGSNGVEEGITVDFSYMNTTTYSAETGLASIQPGSDWERAFTTLDPLGLSVVGGRASVVGVGGFITGGGYSFHSASQGFACDSVANFEMVLADGSVVNANADENADLFKAQKGGSGNLGFVTRVDQRTMTGTQMWGGFVTYDTSKRDEVFGAYVNFCANQAQDEASQNIIALYYDATGFSLRSILTNVDAVPDAPIFDEYFAIDNVSTTLRVGSIAELVPEFTGPTPLGLYANWMVGATDNDVESLTFIEETLRAFAPRMAAAAPDSDFNVLIQFQPVTPSIVRHGEENGGNVLGMERLVADGSPKLMWLLAVTCDTAENQDKILPLQLEFRAAINEWADSKGKNPHWDYLNYAWGDQDPIAKFGEENIALLKGASEKYDPEGVFQKLRHTGFKIPA